MANEIYHRTNWGEAKPEGFGDMYFDPSATNKLYNRSTYYENSDATDKILGDIPNKASIVLTPTGYSEDSINTAIPPYQVLPEELVTNGEFNEQGSWSTLSSTISISNGELTVVSSSGATGAFQNITTEVGKKYKVVALTNSFVTDALVRVTNGSSPSSGYSDNPVVNGVSFFEFTALGTTTNIYLRNTNAGTTIWQSVSVKEIQEADFTFARNSSATRVNQAGLIEASQSNDTPRLDYTTGQGAFLLEPQSTNLITYSEDFSQWTANSGSSVVTNNAISPDGTQNASTFTFDGTFNGRVELLTDGITTSEDVTFSVYLKTLSGTEQVFIGHSSFGFKEVTVDNQWKRYTSTATASAGFAYPRVRIDSATSVLVWGYQLEQQSYATSYIPTNGSTVTRSAETANSSGNSDLFNSTEGVLYAEISALSDDGTNRQIAVSDGSSNNRAYLGFRTQSNQIIGAVVDGGTENFMNHTISDTTTNFKIALKYKENDLALFFNGTKVATDTSATMPSGLNELAFDDGGGFSDFYGKAKGVAVFKEALTDIELEKLTSWRDFRDLAESLEYTLVTIKSDAIVVSAYGTTSGGGGVSGGGSGGGGGY